MSFLYPTFLYALLALALPVIIHLFYFRRFRKVYFSNVRYLREVKEETSMRSRLRNLLVLLLRCLALAALVFAFAQPFLPVEEGVLQGRKAVSIYVDNSFSMDAQGDRAALLQLAKDRAEEIIAAYGPEDRFQVLDNTFSGRSQRLIGREEALSAIAEIGIGPESRRLSRVLDNQRALLETSDGENRLAYLVSDFQRNVTDIAANGDTSLTVTLLPLRSVRQRNVAIDSVWLDAPVAQVGVNNLLLVRVRNHGEEAVDNVRLSVDYNGQEKPEGTLVIPARNYVVDSIYLPVDRGGSHRAVLSVTDFPVTFDDDYFIGFSATERVTVLRIAGADGEDENLRTALQLPVFESNFSTVQNIDYGRLGEYALIVVEGLPDLSSGPEPAAAAVRAGRGESPAVPSSRGGSGGLQPLSECTAGRRARYLRGNTARDRPGQ